MKHNMPSNIETDWQGVKTHIAFVIETIAKEDALIGAIGEFIFVVWSNIRVA